MSRSDYPIIALAWCVMAWLLLTLPGCSHHVPHSCEVRRLSEADRVELEEQGGEALMWEPAGERGEE